MLSTAARQRITQHGRRSLSYYIPTLTERRPDEAGTGGRVSDAGLKVALFGGSGFLGKYVCSELGEFTWECFVWVWLFLGCGHSIRFHFANVSSHLLSLGSNGYMTYLANRGDDMEMRDIKLNFDLGRSRFVFYSPRDRESIKEVIADADVVVNLIGKYYESGQPVQTDKFPYVKYRTNYSFQDTNVDIAYTLADIAKEMQVDHFVHVSSASASPDAVSEWSRTKYAGEQAVLEAFPWATIIRPTQLFGKEDRLLNWFARMAQWYRFVPLCDGGKSLTQPVHVANVAKTILRVVDSPGKFESKVIECAGPKDYTYAELADFVNSITDRNRPIVPVPYAILRSMANVLQYQRDPLLTPDLVDQWSQDFLPSGNEEYLTMKDLAVEPTSIEKEAFGILQFYQVGGHFHRVEGYH